MNDTLVFNHHCLPFKSSQLAKNAIPDFLKICIDASVSISLKTILVDDSIDNNWFRVELSQGYFWQDWFEQNKNNNQFRDEIRVFRRIATSSLFKAEDIGGDLELFDVREKNTGKHYPALRASAWYECPLFSFPTCFLWKTNPLEICIETLTDTGESVENDRQLMNIFNITIWNSVKNDLIKKRNECIRTGRELWNQRKELYSFLTFCGKTSSQLQNWSHGTNTFHQVKKALSVLNTYAEKMKIKSVNGYSHQQLRELGLNYDVSGESGTVSQNRELRKEREFYLPDGNLVFFENHIKLSNGFRIHFYPDPQNGNINIGYIGTHLNLR